MANKSKGITSLYDLGKDIPTNEGFKEIIRRQMGTAIDDKCISKFDLIGTYSNAADEAEPPEG